MPSFKGFTFISLCYSSVHQKTSEPEPSCVSVKSDRSMGHLVDFKSDNTMLRQNYNTY